MVSGAQAIDRFVIRLPELYAKQHAAFFGPERIAVTEASTKAGKSVGALSWQLHQAVNVSCGFAHVWVSPVFSQAKAQMDRLCRWFSQSDPKHLEWQDNRTELSVTVPGGSKLWFKGSDNPDSIYGTDYASAVIDEASRCREEAWFAVRSTTTATRGPIRIIGNVKGRKNWAYRLGRKAESGDPGMSYHKITAWDAIESGVLDVDEIAEARRHLPIAVFNELYLAEPSDDQGNPFGLDAIRQQTAPMSDAPPVAWGWDLAKSTDWTVGIGLDKTGRVARFERWRQDALPPAVEPGTQYWDATERLIRGHMDGQSALIDSTGIGDPIFERISKGRPNVQPFSFTTASKQRLMEGLAVAIQQGRVCFPEGPITAELEAFEYEYTRTGVRYSAPEGMHDDCVCALALAVAALGNARPSPRLKDYLTTAVASDRERFDW